MTDRLFLPFEIALQEFYLAGGCDVTAIRAPGSVLKQFIRNAPDVAVASYMNIQVELATPQSHVSVLGKGKGGQLFEFPVNTRKERRNSG